MGSTNIEKVPFITVYVDKITFGKIYRRRFFIVDFIPDETIILNNEFVRIKTAFNEKWFGDFNIEKILMKQNRWQVFLGEQLTFFAQGTREKRWFQNNYENTEDGRHENWKTKLKNNNNEED